MMLTDPESNTSVPLLVVILILSKTPERLFDPPPVLNDTPLPLDPIEKEQTQLFDEILVKIKTPYAKPAAICGIFILKPLVNAAI